MNKLVLAKKYRQDSMCWVSKGNHWVVSSKLNSLRPNEFIQGKQETTHFQFAIYLTQNKQWINRNVYQWFELSLLGLGNMLWLSKGNHRARMRNFCCDISSAISNRPCKLLVIPLVTFHTFQSKRTSLCTLQYTTYRIYLFLPLASSDVTDPTVMCHSTMKTKGTRLCHI